MTATAAPKPLTARTIAVLAEAGFEFTTTRPYGQTYELICKRADLSGCVLAISVRGGRLVRASRWVPFGREISVRGKASEIGADIQAFARERAEVVAAARPGPQIFGQ